MAWSIEEGDAAFRRLDVISANVLRDASGFTRGNLRCPDVVEQRGLAMVDVTHDGNDGRTRLGSNSFLTLNLHTLQILFDLVLFQDLRRVTELFDHEHRGVLVDRLVDGGHDAHVHQYLDDLGRLDSHLSREVRDGDGLTDTDFAHDGSRRHFETVLAAVGRRLHRPALHTALFLVARAYVASNMQLLTPISSIGVWAAGRGGRARWWRGSRSACLRGRSRRGGLLRRLVLLRCTLITLRRRGCSGLVRTLARLHGRNNLRPLERWVEHRFGRRLGRTLRRLRRGAFRGLCFRRSLQRLFALTRATLFLFTRSLLGSTQGLFLCFLLRGLFFNAAAGVGFDALALDALGFDTVVLALYGLFGLTTLGVYLVLLLTSLFLQHIAFDVRALGTHLDINCAGTTLSAGELDLLLRLAAESDLAGRGIAALTTTVATAQVREELEFSIIADAIVRAGHFDARLIELHEQPIDRYLQDLGELGNGYFCHRLKPH